MIACCRFQIRSWGNPGHASSSRLDRLKSTQIDESPPLPTYPLKPTLDSPEGGDLVLSASRQPLLFKP